MATTAYTQPTQPPMNTLFSKLRPFISNSPSLISPFQRRRILTFAARRAKAMEIALMKENYLDSLSLPFPENESTREGNESRCVLGIDPDLSGALAILKFDNLGSSIGEVYDSPHLLVLVGTRVRRRLDVKSMVQLIQSFDLPYGTRAYIEKSTPFPADGKQGWYSGGFGYGLWIGTLVASGVSVIPVSSGLWKKHYELASGRATKDDSRRVASELFPSLSSQLKRKKDHGRAEALLIAALEELAFSNIEQALLPGEKGIIENYFGTGNEVSQFFKGICKGIVFNPSESYLADVFEGVNKYTSKGYHVQWAGFRYTHFDSPWTFLSSAAAFTLIVLTITQTFFTSYGYFHPPQNK